MDFRLQNLLGGDNIKNYKDYGGVKFGELTAINFSRREGKTTFWNCKCKCGNIVEVNTRAIIRKSKNDCGCGIGKKTNKICIPIGTKFGRLTVVKDTGKRNNHKEVMWGCLCDCGKYVEVSSYSLRIGGTKSCGCYNKDRTRETCKKYNTFDLNGEYGIGITSRGDKYYFDLEDYDKIKNYSWSVDTYGYLIADANNRCHEKNLRMHRVIMDIDIPEIFVDHINHIKTDNRKENLRLVTSQQNTMNRIDTNKYGKTGIIRRGNKWQSQITYNYKNIYLGCYDSVEEAINARKIAEEKYFGEYSYNKSLKIDGGDSH